MGQATNVLFSAFNGGEIGKESLVRFDTIKNYSNCAETIENCVLATEGELAFRGGLGYQEKAESGNLTILLPWVFSVAQPFEMAVEDSQLRIRQDGSTIVREAVTSSITNGSFTGSLTGWTDVSTGAAVASHSSNRLLLTSNGSDVAAVRQQVTTSNPNELHAVDITIERGGGGDVELWIGSTAGGKEYLSQSMRTGFYSLSFTPTGSYYIELRSKADVNRYVDSIEIAAAGDMVFATPWTENVLRSLRTFQSTNVAYIASGAGNIKRIGRVNNTSWFIDDFYPIDGPFGFANIDNNLTITSDVTVGNGTMTSSAALFSSDHVGSLWKLTHYGQSVSDALGGEGQYSENIKVTGIENDRNFGYLLSGTFVATVTLQRSAGNDYSWIDVLTKTAPMSLTYDPGESWDNQIVYWRWIIKAGDYTSGSVIAGLEYSAGVTDGIVSVTAYNSDTSVDIEVIENIGDTVATYNWREGAWSEAQNWPKALGEANGRLLIGGIDEWWASVSDAYESFETGDEDNLSFSKYIATSGQVANIRSILSLNRPIILTDGSEVEVRSTSLDEPITLGNCTQRAAGSYGAADVQPVKVDGQGLYIDYTTGRLNQMVYDPQANGYVPVPADRLHKKICSAGTTDGSVGIVQLAVQRRPDTRVYCIRSDGQCVVVNYDVNEQVLAFSRIKTDGEFESVCVLPNTGGDVVDFTTKRTVNGATVRYFENLSDFEVEAGSEADATFADSYKVVTLASETATISGYNHLEGEEVVVWAGGAYYGKFTVASGNIVLDEALPSGTKVMAGLYYTAPWKSAMLNYGSELGTAMGQIKEANGLQIACRASLPAIWYGTWGKEDGQSEMDALDDRVLYGSSYDEGPKIDDFITEVESVPGNPDIDLRLCLEFRAPFGPVIIRNAVLGMSVNEAA